MWFTDPSCTAVVLSAWSSSTHADVVGNLMTRLYSCSKELTKWNRTTFGHDGTEIRRLEAQLKRDTNAVSRRHALSEIRE